MLRTSEELINVIAREIEPFALSMSDPDDPERHRMLMARMTAITILGIVAAQEVEPGLYWATSKRFAGSPVVIKVDERGGVKTIGSDITGSLCHFDVIERIVAPVVEKRKAT